MTFKAIGTDGGHFFFVSKRVLFTFLIFFFFKKGTKSRANASH